MMDNASTNDTLIRYVVEVLREEGLYYNYYKRRLRYNGYIINLAV